MSTQIIQGWATTADLDDVGHVIVPGAFAESIRKRGLSGPAGVKLLLDHSTRLPAGAITLLEYRPGGLWMEAELDTSISYVADRAKAIAANKGLSFSVGFWPEDYAFVEDRNNNEYLRITKGDLFEVSVVVLPANPAAVMVGKQQKSLPSVAELEAAIAASRQQVALARHALAARWR